MKKTAITLLALVTLVLVNLPAFPQPKWEYNLFARDAEVVANLEQQWATAVLKRDTATLQLLRADDFTLIAPDGKMYNKAAELAMILSPEFKLDSFALQGGKVRVYTGGVVVTGTVVVKGTSKDTDISGQYRFTDVYEPRNNAWQAVHSQLTKVEEDGAAKKETRQPKAKDPQE
jgi:hypothetical protein